MKKILLITILLMIGFTAFSIEIGLDLVEHLEIETEAELDVIQKQGVLTLFSNEDLFYQPWWSLAAIYTPDQGEMFDSYSDAYIFTHGNDLRRLASIALPMNMANTIQQKEAVFPREVYVYQGNILGREELAELIGLDDYFKRKQQAIAAGVTTTIAMWPMVIGGSVALLGFLGSSYQAEALLVGGGIALAGFLLYQVGLASYPNEPLWDHDEVRREIIRYNNEILSGQIGTIP